MGAIEPVVPAGAAVFDARRLERVFGHCFASDYNTRLAGGAVEPLYQPSVGVGFNCLYYREDYFASALHEVAHWCIAGRARRQRVDFGYWYTPDGRDASAQRAFEEVEVKPQALEWHFSRACGYRFRVSVDNLDAAGATGPADGFKRRVLAQAKAWEEGGLPARARVFLDALQKEFGPVKQRPFRLEDLA